MHALDCWRLYPVFLEHNIGCERLPEILLKESKDSWYYIISWLVFPCNVTSNEGTMCGSRCHVGERYRREASTLVVRRQHNSL